MKSFEEPRQEIGTHQEDARLLKQFENPEALILNGEKIDVVDLKPETFRNETPVLYLPGFSATPDTLQEAILRTAEAGRRVISAYAPHGIDMRKPLDKSTLGLESGYPDLPEAELRKVELLRSLIAEKKLDKVSVIAHSEAAIWVTAEAAMHPDLFDNVVLVEPAGMIGKDTFGGLIKRTISDLKEVGVQDKKNAERERYLESKGTRGYGKRANARYVAPMSGPKSVSSDLPASIREIQAIAAADIAPSLKKMHEAGIGITVVHATEDKIYPIEKVKQMLDQHVIDDLYVIEGTHGDIYNKDLYARAPEIALRLLEDLRQGKDKKKK